MRKRLEQLLLVATWVAFSWLAMQAVHELGHVGGAWLSGGTVTRVVLYPTAFSRTEVYPNPHPLLVAWAGPVVGVLLPLAGLLLAVAVRAPGRLLWQFLAGFCLIANGVYLGAGALPRIGDAGDLLRYGAELWQLLGFGLLTVPSGLWLWHGSGAALGFGAAQGRVGRAPLVIALCLLALAVVSELLLGSP